MDFDLGSEVVQFEVCRFQACGLHFGFGDLCFEGPGERGGRAELARVRSGLASSNETSEISGLLARRAAPYLGMHGGLETETLTPCTNHIGDARSPKCHAYSLHFHVQFLETITLPNPRAQKLSSASQAPERHPRVVGPRPHIPKKQIQARSAGRHPAVSMRRIHFIAEPPKAKQLLWGVRFTPWVFGLGLSCW